MYIPTMDKKSHAQLNVWSNYFSVPQIQFPHLAFACGPRSHLLEERTRAAMGATE